MKGSKRRNLGGGQVRPLALVNNQEAVHLLYFPLFLKCHSPRFHEASDQELLLLHEQVQLFQLQVLTRSDR